MSWKEGDVIWKIISFLSLSAFRVTVFLHNPAQTQRHKKDIMKALSDSFSGDKNRSGCFEGGKPWSGSPPRGETLPEQEQRVDG